MYVLYSYDMRTVGPVDGEYVSFKKKIIIFSEWNNLWDEIHPGGQWAITVVILFWTSNPLFFHQINSN